MASKYLQKYPVPEGFHQILHDFTREVLRDQPEDIIKYGVEYFESMRDGKAFKFESKYNIAKGQSPAKKHLPPKPADYGEQARRVVEVSNQRNEQTAHGRQKSEVSVRQSSAGSKASHPEEKKAAKEYVKELYQKVEQDIEEIEEGKIEANNAFFNPQFDEKDMEKIVKIQASAKGMLVRSHLKQTQETIKPQVVYQEEEEDVNVEAPQKPQEDGDYDQ